MNTEILTAIIGALALIASAGIGGYTTWRMKLRAMQAESEMKMEAAALDFSSFLEDWQGLYQELTKLFAETNIDRFMIFRAWNGSLDPRWTTAVFQVREAGQKPVSYVHFELDRDYINRIQEITAGQFIRFNTADLPDSETKRLYEVEGVTSSVWAHLETKKRGGEAAAITYCSFGTHAGVVDDETYTKCRILSGRLKGVAHSFALTNE